MSAQFEFTKQDRHSVYEQMDGLDWSGIKNHLDGWKPGQRGYIEIRKRGTRKSAEQLGYYYAVILPAAFKDFKTDHGVALNFNIGEKMVTLPLTLDTVHWFFKVQYAAYNSGVYMDQSDMNMAECAAFETYVIRWLAEWRNVQVPPADKNWKTKEGEDDENLQRL